MASYYKLELARFSTLLRIQDRAKCGKGGEAPHKKQIYRKGGTPHIKNLYWKGRTPHIPS